MAAGIFILIFKHASTLNEFKTVAIILFVGASARLLLYLTCSFQTGTFREVTSLISGALKIVLGCMFLNLLSSNPKYSVESICLGWGLVDIALSTVELVLDGIESHEDKTKIVEGFIDLGEIVFGILICIELHHGISGHIIYMAASLIAYSLLYILKNALKLKRY